MSSGRLYHTHVHIYIYYINMNYIMIYVIYLIDVLMFGGRTIMLGCVLLMNLLVQSAFDHVFCWVIHSETSRVAGTQ